MNEKNGTNGGCRLVVDCDPGCDDALALLLALTSRIYSEIDILTVAGNVGIHQCTANALRVCALAAHYGRLAEGLALRVHQGAGASLNGEQPSAASVHGRDGLGDVPIRALLKPRSGPKDLEYFWNRARDFLDKKQSASDVYAAGNDGSPSDLLCIGPLTNVALALLKIPPSDQSSFWKRWRRVVIMGGALNTPGNISYGAEFNAHADPAALDIVLTSWNRHFREAQEDPTPLVLVPLDVTQRLAFWAKETKSKELQEDPYRRAVLCLLRKYFLFHSMNYDPIVLTDEDFASECTIWLDDPAERSCAARRVKAAYNRSRFGGGTGLKELPRWCFLHDPVAMWVVLNWEGLGLHHAWGTLRFCSTNHTCLRRMHLRVDQGPGEGRGHLLPAEPRRFFHSDSSAQDARGDLHMVPVLTEAVVDKLRTPEEGGFLRALAAATTAAG